MRHNFSNNSLQTGDSEVIAFHETLSYNTQLALHELLSGFSGDWSEASSRANLLRLVLHSEISITPCEKGYAVHMLEDDYLCLVQAANEEAIESGNSSSENTESFSDWFSNNIQS